MIIKLILIKYQITIILGEKYMLDFHNRVEMPLIKNFQIVNGAK